MKRKRKRMLSIILSSIGILFILIIIYFNIPYSKLKSEFKNSTQNAITQNKATKSIYTKETFVSLPKCVQKFYQYARYIDKSKATHMQMFCEGADFVNTNMNKTLVIDYTEEVFAKPARFAFIDTALFGVPFQGLDKFDDGKGSMKGVVAKNIQIFNTTGEEMDKAALATWLCEAILLPEAMLNNNIIWNTINDLSAEATLEYDGMKVSAIFLFNENGQLISSTTDDRSMAESDGSMTPKRWSLLFDKYKENEGYTFPLSVKSVWHMENGYLEYFNSDCAKIKFD